MERKTIKKELDEIETCDYEERVEYIDVDKLLIQLQTAKNKYDGKLKIRLDTCDHWACSPSPMLILEHPETDEEYEERINREKEIAARDKKHRRKQYEKLKKEFE